MSASRLSTHPCRAFALALTLSACGGSRPPPTVVLGAAHFPTASKLSPTALPRGITWEGVWVMSTGARGTMHILTNGDDRFHGCWLAENRRARATFVGIAMENIAMFAWEERRIGFVGPPQRLSAYLVLTPAEGGAHEVTGEQGRDLRSDTGVPWKGVRQRYAYPAPERGCDLDEGDD